jgi:phosphomethylpyrimidine synthase
VLGPLVTDIAPGYDHITSAIGGALAASAGADFLCYVTPSEHLKLPDQEDVRLGVMAARIAAHTGDIAKGIPNAIKWDKEMAAARKTLDWEKQFELSIDPQYAKKLRAMHELCSDTVCSMCGEYCAIKLVNSVLSK